MDATGDRPRDAGRRSPAARCGRRSLAADHPERVDGDRLHRARRVALAPGHPERRRARFDDGARRPTRGGRSTTATTGTRDYLGFLEFFFAKCFNEPHSTKQIEDCVGWALETTPETLADTDARHRAASRRGVRARRCATRPLPDARDPRRPRPDPPARAGRGARRADRRAAGDARGRRPRPERARPGQGQPALRDFVAPPRAAARAGRGPRRAAGARCTSPRRSASATRGATSRSPTSCARLHPDLEIDWLAQHPVTDGARGARRADPPRQRASSPASPRTSQSEAAEHDLHVLRGVAADGRDPASRTSWSSTTSSARSSYDLWIGDEAWELDYFLHENPELKTAAYVWLTDFVGWLPMAGRRRARGVPDRRLQRRDDRADRALPARARPVDLRRRPRGHRPRHVRPRPARRSATGPSSTSASPATSPASTRRRSPTASALRAELGYGARRAGLHRHRRRLGRRRAPAARG